MSELTRVSHPHGCSDVGDHVSLTNENVAKIRFWCPTGYPGGSPGYTGGPSWNRKPRYFALSERFWATLPTPEQFQTKVEKSIFLTSETPLSGAPIPTKPSFQYLECVRYACGCENALASSLILYIMGGSEGARSEGLRGQKHRFFNFGLELFWGG